MIKNSLIIIVIACFIAVLVLNFYFRLKVFALYKKLYQNRVEFGAAHFFNREKLEAEVLSKYPQFRKEIEEFIHKIRFSMQLATILIVLITLFGAILMYFK